MLSKNEGPADRVIRVLLGSLIGYIGIVDTTGFAQLILLIIASILLITGLSGFCLIYTILGFSTCHQPDNTP